MIETQKPKTYKHYGPKTPESSVASCCLEHLDSISFVYSTQSKWPSQTWIIDMYNILSF